MNKIAFLEIAKNDSSVFFNNEARILESLIVQRKAVILSSNSIDCIIRVYTGIHNEIKVQKSVLLKHYHVNNNGEYESRDISRASLSEEKLINIALNICGKNYKGFVFVVCEDVYFLLQNGKFNEVVGSCLAKKKTYLNKKGLLQPVSEIKKVFDHFNVDCEHGTYYYDYFQDDGIIKKNILEKDLRNFLIDYLKSCMNTDVIHEYATNKWNDHEAVDIFLKDAYESAMIEVKFAFSENNYAGKTFYDLADRAKAGYFQLDKYAKSLIQDDEYVRCSYLYIFHMIEEKEDEVIEQLVEDIYISIEAGLSNDFKSQYESTCYNNMHKWAKPLKH